MADFSNFELGQNVAELADGLIPEMAEVFEVPLSDQPTVEELGQLVGRIGQKKTLQDNILDTKAQLVDYIGSEDAAVAMAAQWLDRSGVQNALNRSLWTPDAETPLGTATILTGAVANWQDRAGYLVADTLREEGGGEVYMLIGNRTMDSPTDKANFNVGVYLDDTGHYPTEAQYAGSFIKPILQAAGAEVMLEAYPTGNGQEIADAFVDEYHFAFNGYVRVARVANAGIQLAGQFVSAARHAFGNFDDDKKNPKTYVLTDEFPIARDLEQVTDPKQFQNPFTGIRQVVVTAKEITALQV